MIHPVVMLAGGGGGGGASYSVSYSPPGGVYSVPPSTKSVTITISGGSKFRWKIDSGAYTTVNGTSTSGVIVNLISTGKTLYTDILDGNNNVLFSYNATYYSNQ